MSKHITSLLEQLEDLLAEENYLRPPETDDEARELFDLGLEWMHDYASRVFGNRDLVPTVKKERKWLSAGKKVGPKFMSRMNDLMNAVQSGPPKSDRRWQRLIAAMRYLKKHKTLPGKTRKVTVVMPDGRGGAVDILSRIDDIMKHLRTVGNPTDLDLIDLGLKPTNPSGPTKPTPFKTHPRRKPTTSEIRQKKKQQKLLKRMKKTLKKHGQRPKEKLFIDKYGNPGYR